MHGSNCALVYSLRAITLITLITLVTLVNLVALVTLVSVHFTISLEPPIFDNFSNFDVFFSVFAQRKD